VRGTKLILCLIYFFVGTHGRADRDGPFRLCVQFSEFTAKLDDGCSVDVPWKSDEWVVD